MYINKNVLPTVLSAHGRFSTNLFLIFFLYITERDLSNHSNFLRGIDPHGFLTKLKMSILLIEKLSTHR